MESHTLTIHRVCGVVSGRTGIIRMGGTLSTCPIKIIPLNICKGTESSFKVTRARRRTCRIVDVDVVETNVAVVAASSNTFEHHLCSKQKINVYSDISISGTICIWSGWSSYLKPLPSGGMDRDGPTYYKLPCRLAPPTCTRLLLSMVQIQDPLQIWSLSCHQRTWAPGFKQSGKHQHHLCHVWFCSHIKPENMIHM